MLDTKSDQIREKIVTVIDEVFTDWQQQSRFPLDQQLVAMLQEMSGKGKLFRGTLLVNFYQLASDGRHLTAAIQVAAAVELFGTALLIHDDIMDRATERRGIDTVDVQMSTYAKKHHFSELAHFGLSTAICAGDFLFFVAQRLLADVDVPAKMRQQLSSISANELALLGLAQAEDIRQASASSGTTQEILAMYAGKTGRYTGRWPLEMAAVLAELDSLKQQKLSHIGEQLGVIYQLQDDYLGLFGDEKSTGKSVTSDLTEGKKTLFYAAYARHQDCDHQLLERVFGNSQASLADINALKQAMSESGVVEEVRSQVQILADETQTAIDQLALHTGISQFLSSVLQFTSQRQK